MNVTKVALATVIALLALMAMDYVLHQVLLMGIYETTPELWRPMDEMKPVFMMSMMFLSVLAFVLFYNATVGNKSAASGMKFGMWVGILLGLSMFMHYSYMPISLTLAASWFAGTFVELLVAGTLVGLICKN